MKKKALQFIQNLDRPDFSEKVSMLGLDLIDRKPDFIMHCFDGLDSKDESSTESRGLTLIAYYPHGDFDTVNRNFVYIAFSEKPEGEKFRKSFGKAVAIQKAEMGDGFFVNIKNRKLREDFLDNLAISLAIY